MTALAWFVLAFAIIQMVVAAANYLARPLSGGLDGYTGLVSVLIPARNEAGHLPHLLGDLQAQSYFHFEVIVFDDQSSDETAGVVEFFADKDSRFRLVSSPGLPSAWLGKNFGCNSLSELAHGEYYLFLDADVRVSAGLIEKTLGYLRTEKLGLLSIFPVQQIKTPGEWMTVPIMNQILLSLLPLILVKKSGYSSVAAANGQFMLFAADAYKQLKPHRVMKDRIAEDIEIARYFKKNGMRIACNAGQGEITCRMYSSYSEAIQGFTKNIRVFFGNSLLLAFLFWGVTGFGFIPVFHVFSRQVFVMYLSVLLLTRIVVSLASRQSVAGNLLYMIPQQLTMGVLLVNSFLQTLYPHLKWKGRKI